MYLEEKVNLMNFKLDKLLVAVAQVLQKENLIMATLDELQAQAQTLLDKITALNTALDGYRDLVATTKAELDQLKSGAVLAPAVQAKVDAIGAKLTEDAAAIDATYDENFPPPPPASETPTEPTV